MVWVAVVLLSSTALLVRPVRSMCPYHDDRSHFADVYISLERDIADIPGTEASILYFQEFSEIPCVMSAFAKRGVIIVSDQNINFAIQNSLQISRSAVRWFDHNSLKGLKVVLLNVENNAENGGDLLRDHSLLPRASNGAMVDFQTRKLFAVRDSYALV